ncbi:MAG: 1-deoxy-D-xylulose-5-phosphate reductoisomerase [Nitrospirota bacterium]|jgi:1-deoxy-D-xylulose-5-phosphate reductoisomerase
MKPLSILGATGSIGRSTCDLVRRNRDRFVVRGLTAHRRIDLLAEQIREFQPAVAAVADPALLPQLRALVGRTATELLAGEEGLSAVATYDDVEMVVAAIVGAAGLLPTLAAARAGKTIGLANKETLVMAGNLFVRELNAGGGRLLPIDSEHSAIFQCLAGNRHDDVRRIILTASGGPFFAHPAEDLHRVTREQALDHPNWSMGAKITIDSATLMNKGLEVIEAHFLFDQHADAIEVVIHPQSIVHSLVEFCDGQLIAQLGMPDMRGPIAYALAFPERLADAMRPLDLLAIGRLDFHPPDRERFPCLRLGYQALQDGGALPCVLNAANEEAVAAFLADRIPFAAIAQVTEEVMVSYHGAEPASLPEVLAVDEWARHEARQRLAARV